MKRISPSKRAAAKRARNLEASLPQGDRDELAKFREYLRDPAPHGVEKYEAHYGAAHAPAPEDKTP